MPRVQPRCVAGPFFDASIIWMVTMISKSYCKSTREEAGRADLLDCST